MRGRRDELDLVVRVEDDESRRLGAVGTARSVEAQRRPDAARDRARRAGEHRRVRLRERPARLAARDVHGAPGASAEEEHGPQLVRDAGRDEQIAVAGAALRGTARRLVEDPDRGAAASELRERVEVLDQVLAAHHDLAGRVDLVGCEDAALHELVRRIAGHEPRVRVQRVPARRVAGERAPQAGRELGEELPARQAPGAQQRDLLDQPLGRPWCRHALQRTRRAVRGARNIPGDGDMRRARTRRESSP